LYNVGVKSEGHEETQTQYRIKNFECAKSTRKEIIMKKNIFTINFTNSTISGSKSALKKASNPASAEYKELTAKMAAHPTFKVVEKEPNTDKNTYKGMDFKMMRDYINAQPNAKELMAEFDLAVAMYQAYDERTMVDEVKISSEVKLK